MRLWMCPNPVLLVMNNDSGIKSLVLDKASDFEHAFNVLTDRFNSMQPELALTVADPSLGMEGYVVVWNTKIAGDGPLAGVGKGGSRCEATLDLAQVGRLARTMAIKNAAAGLPLGGAKSGVKMDRDDPRYERKWRRFVELTAPVLHERGGPFGGYGYDKGCHIPENAVWAVDELKTKQIGSERSFTGKPVEMGGTDYDREGIAGLGVAVAARTLLETVGKSAHGARFAVQGVGAMGAGICRYFSEYGGKLTALSDPLLGGVWVLENELSNELIEAVTQSRFDALKELLPQEGRKISDDVAAVLFQDVDVLFPAATEDVITAKNAGSIKAPFIVEGANNPTSEEAHQILFAGGKLVIPDVIANPGGIIAAFVEITTPTTAEIIQSRAKVQRAKDLTINKVSANTRHLLEMVTRLGVQSNHVGNFMAFQNIFLGFQ
jgi:glutamate dehydrogenase (NAD(P)+)